MEAQLRQVLIQAGDTLPDDPAIKGVLLMVTSILAASNVLTLWKWFRHPAPKDRVKVNVDVPAGQVVEINTHVPGSLT